MSHATASPQWSVIRASVRGKAHVDNGTPNQDAQHVICSPDGSRVAAVVCDGAGTAARAEDGAKHFARRICQQLFDLGDRVARRAVSVANRSQVNDEIYGMVQAVRNELDTGGTHLAEYHCTLVAILVTPDVRIFLKLGDSVLLKTRFADLPDGKVDYFLDLAMTQQERSDYANETHFVTQPDWRDHLVRDTISLDAPDMMYALMTDGAADIALQGLSTGTQKRVYRGFFGNLVANLLAVKDHERDAILHAALDHSGTYRLTGDDKTIVLLLRSDAFTFSGREPLLDEPAARAPTSAPATPVAGLASDVASAPPPSVTAKPPIAGDVGNQLGSAAVSKMSRHVPRTSSTVGSKANASLATGSGSAQSPVAAMTGRGRWAISTWLYVLAGTLAVVLLGTAAVKLLDQVGHRKPTQQPASEGARSGGEKSTATSNADPSSSPKTGDVAPASVPAPRSQGGSPSDAPSPSATPTALPTPVPPPAAGVGRADSAQIHTTVPTAPSQVIIKVAAGAKTTHEVILNLAPEKVPGGRVSKTFELDEIGEVVATCTPKPSMPAALCSFVFKVQSDAKPKTHIVQLADVSPLGSLHAGESVLLEVRKVLPPAKKPAGGADKAKTLASVADGSPA